MFRQGDGDIMLEADGAVHELSLDGSVFSVDQPSTNADALNLKFKCELPNAISR